MCLLRYFLLFTILLIPPMVKAQKMVGIITELATGQPVADVVYENIFLNESGVTDSSGRFSLNASSGQLIVFQKLGYKTVRVRIPSGKIPPFFKIQLQPGALELEEVEVRDKHRDYHTDSLRNALAYKRELEYKKLSGAEMIQHPFTALSRHYQQIMRFQKEYNYLEQQRYVDYAFNEKIITRLTGLQGEDLQEYMRLFRPSYDLLRSLPEYYYFSYIKESAAEYQKRKQARRAYERTGQQRR
jgi:hypothetical protein